MSTLDARTAPLRLVVERWWLTDKLDCGHVVKLVTHRRPVKRRRCLECKRKMTKGRAHT